MGSLVEATISRSVDFHVLQAFCNVIYLDLLWNELKGIGLEEHEEACRTPIAQRAPNCLTVNLKTFDFFFFQGMEVEMDFVRYILKNLLMLESMSICAEQIEPERRFAVLQKLVELKGAPRNGSFGFALARPAGRGSRFRPYRGEDPKEVYDEPVRSWVGERQSNVLCVRKIGS